MTPGGDSSPQFADSLPAASVRTEALSLLDFWALHDRASPAGSGRSDLGVSDHVNLIRVTHARTLIGLRNHTGRIASRLFVGPDLRIGIKPGRGKYSEGVALHRALRILLAPEPLMRKLGPRARAMVAEQSLDPDYRYLDDRLAILESQWTASVSLRKSTLNPGHVFFAVVKAQDQERRKLLLRFLTIATFLILGLVAALLRGRSG